MTASTSLLADDRLRRVIAAPAAFLVLLVLTQLVFPDGTPAAILFTGVTFGLVNALTAVGLIVVYRTVRVINFAQTAIGAAGAELTFQLVQQTGAPFILSLAAGLLLAGALGLGFDLVFGRRFFNASRLVLTVLTIAVAGMSIITVQAVSSLPFFSEGGRDFAEELGAEPIRDLLPLAGFDFTVGSFPVPFGFPEVFAIEAALVALIAVAAFFRFTRAGVAVRAMAENRERASLLGISVGSLSSIVWTISGLLGGLSVILLGMLDTPGSARGVAPGILLPALAAAVLGRFERIPTAVAAAVFITVLAQAFSFSFGDQAGLVPALYLAIIAGGLLFQSRGAQRSEEGAGVSWQATDEVRPIPRELASLSTVRIGRAVLVTIGLSLVLVYPFLVPTGAIIMGGVIALLTVVGLSVVVLTGWAGQVSLGQWAFAAIGAVVAGSLTSRVGLSFWLAVPIATIVCAACAVGLGIPALRIRGLFLAVTTLAFAYAVSRALFDEQFFGWLLPTTIDRPTLFFLDFADQRSMYYLCIATLVLAILVVTNLRRSRVGRVLIAARENEANLQALGVNLARTKLIGFSVAGGLAGMAGAVYGHQQLGVGLDAFPAQTSIDIFLFTVIGGVGSVGGALLGSVAWNSLNYFFAGNPVVGFLLPISAALILYVAPGGIVSLLVGMRDEVLRVIAQRRQIVVPSLFADYDPDALERRLIPLRAGEDDSATSPTEPYALASELYRGRGQRLVDKLAPGRSARESDALDAAAAGAAAESDSPTPSGAAR